MPNPQTQQCTVAHWLQGEPCEYLAGTDTPNWSLQAPETGEHISEDTSADTEMGRGSMQSTCKAMQQDLRGRPPLRILLALESATQACRHGVKQRCWEQQSAWQQAERLLWAHAAPFKVWLVKRHRTCCSGTQRMVVPPADHSKCRLLPLTNSFGLCMDSWLNSNQGKAITISQLRGRHCSGHHLPSRIHSYSIR